jgi:hypothetical protein
MIAKDILNHAGGMVSGHQENQGGGVLSGGVLSGGGKSPKTNELDSAQISAIEKYMKGFNINAFA